VRARVGWKAGSAGGAETACVAVPRGWGADWGPPALLSTTGELAVRHREDYVVSTRSLLRRSGRGGPPGHIGPAPGIARTACEYLRQTGRRAKRVVTLLEAGRATREWSSGTRRGARRARGDGATRAIHSRDDGRSVPGHSRRTADRAPRRQGRADSTRLGRDERSPAQRSSILPLHPPTSDPALGRARGDRGQDQSGPPAPPTFLTRAWPDGRGVGSRPDLDANWWRDQKTT